jgi:hypothetical protein
MRTLWKWLTLVLLYSTNLGAEFGQPASNLELSGGYRHDNFEWNFAGGRRSPDELWRMKFSKIQSWEVSGNYNYTTCNNYYFRISGNYAQIESGHAQATGYAADRRHFHFSTIKGKANKGHANDIAGCLGYTFTSDERRFIGTPVLGWSWKYQYFRMHDAQQILNKPRELLRVMKHVDLHSIPRQGRIGDIHDLKVEYDPRWFGPFLGFDWMAMIEPCIIAYGKVEWHFTQLRANGKWDLKHRYLLNFNDHSNGHGIVVSLGGNYKLGNGWFIGVNGEYRNFQTGKGTHRTTKFEDNSIGRHKDFRKSEHHKHFAKHHEHFPRIDQFKIFGRMPYANTRLNRVQWNSYCIEFTIDYRYWSEP